MVLPLAVQCVSCVGPRRQAVPLVSFPPTPGTPGSACRRGGGPQLCGGGGRRRVERRLGWAVRAHRLACTPLAGTRCSL